MTDDEQKKAVFWCSLLKPVLFGDIDPQGTNRFLRDLAEMEVEFPDGTSKKPSLSTLWRKLKAYRDGGFEALARKRRSDRGTSRAHGEKVVSRAIELKRDLATRSDRIINQFIGAEFGKGIPKSTLNRHLRDVGATRSKLIGSKKPVRRRWTRDHTHDLWIGDFENGPYVLYEGTPVPTYLSVFIDCHSRFCIEARYYYRSSLDILIDSLLRAWSTYGAPAELYLDNAKIYHANALKAACFALNINLLHRKKGDPPPGGLIERFIETCQSQYENEVRAGDILSLDRLNRGLYAWLEMTYHPTPHSETKQPPQGRYEQGLTVIRHVDMEAIIPYFMHREKRTVHKDFSDVQLNGRFYRVDKRYRLDRVEVRYDPFSLQDTVLIYSLRGEYLGKGTLHNREEGEPARPVWPPSKPKYSYIDLVIQQHEEELQSETQAIDYRKAVTETPWPFPAFAKTFAQLMGRRGNLSAFSTEELEVLQKLHVRIPTLTKALLVEAFERAEEKSIPYVAHQLQQLADRKER